MQLVKDLLLSAGLAIAVVVVVVLICIPLTFVIAAIFAAITWCVVQITGWSWGASQLVVLGTTGISCLTWSFYSEKRRVDAWIASIRIRISHRN